MFAEKVCVRVNVNYGRMLETGDGIPTNQKEGERYIKMAAYQKCINADQ